ncbi:MAG: DUF58 domain-containing protein [Oscillospiraceae bacterium]|nr:DUF58 domain-containing protein [Oscillospiraceae bacterium]
MLRRWLLYLATLAGCIVFLFAYQQRYAWVILLAVLCLPLLGLMVSLPMMLTTKLRLTLPSHCVIGEHFPVSGEFHAPLGNTQTHWHLQVGQARKAPGTALPTQHCGMLLCRPVRVRIYDCLGLFFFVPRTKKEHRLFVRPTALPVSDFPELERRLTQAWRPKYGGGLAENHEIRLYRPGDSLNQIHWKLSAKAGKLVIREAMEPLNSQAILALTLGGTPEEMDRKLGRLLWLGSRLLEQNLQFCVRAASGKQILQLQADSPEALMSVLDQLLAAPPAAGDAPADSFYSPRLYTIGGEPDEN